MDTVYIFDIKNRQEEYSAVLEFIRGVRETQPGKSAERRSVIEKIAKKISISVGTTINNIAKVYYEQPIQSSGEENITSEGIQGRHLFCDKDLYALPGKNAHIKFHIRVHLIVENNSGGVSEAELIHLQYLALLLKKMSYYFPIEELKYVSVFIVPLTGESYPFCDQNNNIDYTTYTYVSKYLRLLSKQYRGIIYGVKEKQREPYVRSLNFKINKKSKTCFPLIIIDTNSYNKLFICNVKDDLDDLFSLKKNGRYRNSRDEDPNLALEDFIAEIDVYRIREVISEEYYHRILEFFKAKKEITLMELSLFSFMLSENIDNVRVENVWENVWHFSSEITMGLRQVAQNAIQHTEAKECFLSFCYHERRKEESRSEFVNRISQVYPDTAFDMSSGEGALEIFISDLNDKEDMIDNFISNLEYEQNDTKKKEDLVGHSKLIACKERLALRNFFSEYERDDARNAWREFRQEDLIAHIGLSQFAQIARKCEASVRVMSNKYSKLTDEKRYFYHAYNRKKLLIESDKKNIPLNKSVIPGMQFSILIPVHMWNFEPFMGIAQLKQQNHVAEDYASFAAFLKYDEERINITLRENGEKFQYTDLLDAKKKYNMVQKWRNYWENKIENIGILIEQGREHCVFNYDFQKVAESQYFENSDRVEVFLKGLINALSIVNNRKALFLIALTNLPLGFVDIFRKICVQFSVKKFPANMQLCLYEQNLEKGKKIVFLGKDFSEAIYNSYVLSMEHGIAGFDNADFVKASELKEMLLLEEKEKKEKLITKKVGACPFDIILHYTENDSRTFFEIQLKNMAEGALAEETVGYKLNDTHMRLGSKVHIESFYEMSFLFYRTTIANRLAVNILRDIRKGNLSEDKSLKIDLLKDNIIFYGYASYSKAILTSLSEILREYRKRNAYEDFVNKVAFASFQHNLMLESEETQMYFDLPKTGFPGQIDTGNRLVLEEKIRVVQIVPISSTLTTFDKMWKKFSSSIVSRAKQMVCLSGNYTVFWVVDQAGDFVKGKPSTIEDKYWEEVSQKQIIKTKLPALIEANNSCILYYLRSAVVWHDPVGCELCYPSFVIDEVPLVETDPTSTVPTQQIRYIGNQTRAVVYAQKDYMRFKELRDCVTYDHICRRQNHYQFYIDTQRYFYNVKNMVSEWLQSYGKKERQETKGPVLNIIFSPEHNTNVGFVQYVNTYYFNGLAEIVSINVDKQIRSNFICEHAALKRIIEELHQDWNSSSSLPVKFYFVDDTIITGDTLEKANGLLHSLVPMGMYPVNLFSKIFVLIDRLSDTTKQMYISEPEHNFISFIHIDVSNVRTHGDSCIGCKLEQDAKKMYKRSATKNMALYWSGKVADYRKKAYDSRTDLANIEKEKSYRRLLMAHILQNIIIKQGRCYQLGDAYDVILNISLWMLGEKENVQDNVYGYKAYLSDMRNMEGIKALLKTVCRPFFTYDFKIKRQAYTFFIYIAELMLGQKSSEIFPEDLNTHTQVAFLQKNNRIKKTELLTEKLKYNLASKNHSQLAFICKYILEGLTDMNSTYLMRKQTLKKFYVYLEGVDSSFSENEKSNFWDMYGVFIHRLVTGNVDESRELWLEYLYMTGMEYGDFKNMRNMSDTCTYEPHFLYETISGKKKVELKERYFYRFCHNLFLQNTGINFDKLDEENISSRKSDRIKDGNLNICWQQMRCLDAFVNPLCKDASKNSESIEAEENLFVLLKNEQKGIGEIPVNKWYETFIDYLQEVICKKHHLKREDINIALLTETNEEKKDAEKMQLLNIILKEINCRDLTVSETCYRIKERVLRELEKDNIFALKEDGYTICENPSLINGNCRPYVIAFFDNQEKSVESYERSLTSIFLYISIGTFENNDKLSYTLKLILREIMTYRNRILRFLKKDFGGEIYASYARTTGEKNILSHEKAHSHNTTGDDELTLEIFRGIHMFEDGETYEVLEKEQAAEWLLLRNYTNGQIAKIFNRGFHDDKEKNSSSKVPMLYINPTCKRGEENVFKQKLIHFSDLNLKGNNEGQDKRFELLRQIMDIQYDENLDQASFIQGENGQYYNLEYFKCILTDIMLSAIKYECERSNFLTRVDRFLDINKRLKNNKENSLENITKLQKEACQIYIYRKPTSNPEIDFLVIRNRVDGWKNRFSSWERENNKIAHRLKDPLDYADGHMSLLAIKRYVENLKASGSVECLFKYTLPYEEWNEKGKLYFESCLPVLNKKENLDEKNILD